MNAIRIVTACAVIWAGGAVPAAAADAVTVWNDIAINNINAAGQGPAGIVTMAKVHLAIHDAVQAFAHDAETYCVDINGASGSPSAAVAAAARDVLVATLPDAQDTAVNAAYSGFLMTNGLVGNAGITAGQQAAACILKLRANDGFGAAVAPFFGVNEVGQWRSATAMSAPWLGDVTPFAARDGSQFTADVGPPALRSGHYARDYDEVKALGSKTGSTRTAEQTELANFYSDALPVLFQRVIRTVIETYGRDLSENARAFALAEAAAADAVIAAWANKIHFNFWRPVTAIQEGNFDGNDRTVGDPTWEPFLATPPYPDYTSGANTQASALMRALELVFRSDRLPFVAESKAAAATQKFRPYDRLSDLCRDVIEVRIYQGIHFRFADEVAYRLGRQAADWTVSHILKPTR